MEATTTRKPGRPKSPIKRTKYSTTLSKPALATLKFLAKQTGRPHNVVLETSLETLMANYDRIRASV